MKAGKLPARLWPPAPKLVSVISHPSRAGRKLGHFPCRRGDSLQSSQPSAEFAVFLRENLVGTRTTESQHGRGWKGPLWVTQPNPLPKQGHPEQAAQDHVQVGLEYLHRISPKCTLKVYFAVAILTGKMGSPY